MSIKCLFKYFAVAIAVQIGFFILVILFHDQKFFPYIDWIYWPWVWLVDKLAGPRGPASHAMAGTEIFGGLMGLVGNSLLAGVVICYFKGRWAKGRRE